MRADLSERGFLSDLDRLVPLGGGRTNRVWKLSGPAGVRVLKLYRQASNNPLFPNHPTDEATCLAVLEGTGLAPRLIGAATDSNMAWIIYAYTEGAPWRSGPDKVACLLTALHHQTPPEGLRAVASGSAALTEQALSILRRCSSPQADFLAARAPVGMVPPCPTNRFLHGDPVAGNILVAGANHLLIDWQCPAVGDPAEDLAIFLSPAMQSLYRGSPLTVDEEERFLRACEDRSAVERYEQMKPWFHWRMAAYCLWQSETGNSDYAPAIALETAMLDSSRSARPIDT